VFGITRKEDKTIEVKCLKERETSKDFNKFWGDEIPRLLLNQKKNEDN
jgi:hypothetical protein